MNRYSWILKKAGALLIALMLLCSVLPAAVAVSADWSQNRRNPQRRSNSRA